MIERISGSRAHRVWRCPASAVLPHVDEDGEKPPAVRGKQIHAYLERVRAVGVEAALVEQPEAIRPYLLTLDVESLPTHLATEVAFAYNWRTRVARELGRNLDRTYPELEPDEDPLTVDLLGVDAPNRRAFVGDYKTGHTRYPNPARFGQTLLGALCARSVYGVEDVDVELIYLGADGDDYRARGRLDEWDLDAWAEEWSAARALVHTYAEIYASGRGVPVREGPHCAHCPAFVNCPAKIAFVRAMPTELEGIKRPGYMAPERLAQTYHEIQRFKEVLGVLEGEIFANAAREPIDLGDGRMLGIVNTRRESLIGDIAAAVLEQWHGPEARAEAIKISLSKEALRDAVAKRRKEGEKIATKREDGVLDLILAEIRRRGGIEVTTTTNVRPYNIRKVLKAGDD